MKEPCYIVDAGRTAIGNFGGGLSAVHPADTASHLIQKILERTGLDPALVGETLLGCVLQAGHGQNVARQSARKAGIPDERTAMTVNMVCGSGLRSVALSAGAVALGDSDLVVAGGTETMSLTPYLLKKGRYGYRMGNGELIDSMVYDGLWDIFNDYHMGLTAENLAERYGITREEQDRFAAASQNKAEAAMKAGRFSEEIIPFPVPQRKGDPEIFDTDEYPRAGVTAEGLSKLKPAFKKDGTVTAGNSSGINDGAAIVLVAGRKTVEENKLEPLARIVSYGYAGTDPAVMGIAPVEAVRKAMDRAGWSMDDLDLIEANEAFAAQAIAVNRELGWDPNKINVNGGAVALGHPIGASGARILVTLLYEMKRRKLKRGIAALCIGGGMGIALTVERD
jgi:acetyl-CoA C-acetyltransferase